MEGDEEATVAVVVGKECGQKDNEESEEVRWGAKSLRSQGGVAHSIGILERG